MRISQHISTLLFSYDCVIIPGLGGFVANHAPARIHPRKHLASPPSKGIIFNKNLTSNDGLLTDFIARTESISYSDARDRITSFVGKCYEELSAGNRIVFDDLGILFYDKEKNIQFQPDFTINFLIDSFGLVPVVAHPAETENIIQEENIQPQDEAVVIPIDNIEKEKGKARTAAVKDIGGKSLLKKYWPVAAVLVPLTFYSFWIPLGTDFIKTGTLELSDLNPFHKAEAISFQSRKNKFEFSSLNNTSHEWEKLIAQSGGPVTRLKISDENDNYLNVFVIPHVPESTLVAKDVKNVSFRHHVIAGCFRELTNAEQMVADLQKKGYPARILDTHNGLHRVAAASYADKKEALFSLKEIRSNTQSSAWLLNK